MSSLKDLVGQEFFARRVRPSLQILEDELKLNQVGSVFLSYNGGKDCTVLLELLEHSGFLFEYDIKILNFEESDPFEELELFTRARISEHACRVIWCSSDVKEELKSLVKYRELKSVLLGQRSTDPGCPPSPKEPSSENWPQFTRICPIFDWTYADVWHFLLRLRARYCPLYDLGFSSLGPRGKTLPNPELKGRPAYTLNVERSEREGRQA